jgi:hypothetical protein
LQKINKQARKPTAEEFLQFIPNRREFPWSVGEDGLVHIVVPKFQSRLGRKLCGLIRKKNEFCADMDRIGSFVWERCDGKTSVDNILKELEKDFPDEKNIDQRLFVFLTQMAQLDYLELVIPV